MMLPQTESPYMQGGHFPSPLQTCRPSTRYHDLLHLLQRERQAWALLITADADDYNVIYGAGLYSFFDEYDQSKLKTSSCQRRAVAVDVRQGGAVQLYCICTVGISEMVSLADEGHCRAEELHRGFCSSLALIRP